MAFAKDPATWLGAGYAVASNKAEFNTQTAGSNKLLPRIIDADADPSTGDIRLLFYALCEMELAAWNAIAAVNRPVQMTVAKKDITNGTSIQRTFSVTFNIDSTATTVLAEP